MAGPGLRLLERDDGSAPHGKGEPVGTTTVMQAYIDGVSEEMRRDPRIFLLGNDLVRGGSFGQVRGLADEFGPERVRDTPISEAAIASAGVGAALNGMRPLVDFNFIDFALG